MLRDQMAALAAALLTHVRRFTRSTHDDDAAFRIRTPRACVHDSCSACSWSARSARCDMQALVLVRQWLSVVELLRAHADALATALACGALAILIVRFLVVRAYAHALAHHEPAPLVVRAYAHALAHHEPAPLVVRAYAHALAHHEPAPLVVRAYAHALAHHESAPLVVRAQAHDLVAHGVAALVNPLNVWMTLLARRALSPGDDVRALVVDTRDIETGARTALRAVLVAFRDQASAAPRSPRAVAVSLGVLALQQIAMQTSMLLVTLAYAGELARAFVVVGVLVYASEIAMTLAVERTLTGPLSKTSLVLRFVTQPLAMLALPFFMLAALVTSDTVRKTARRLVDVLAPDEVRAAERHTPRCATVVVTRFGPPLEEPRNPGARKC
jgi:hypothetical protein